MRGGDGLFHQHMGAGFQEGAHDGGMGDGRRADRNQVDLAQQLAPVGHGQHAMLGGDGAADIGAGIGDGEQLDARNGTIFGAMVTAKGADADDGSLERPLFRNAAADEHSEPLVIKPGSLKARAESQGTTHKMFRLVTRLK